MRRINVDDVETLGVKASFDQSDVNLERCKSMSSLPSRATFDVLRRPTTSRATFFRLWRVCSHFPELGASCEPSESDECCRMLKARCALRFRWRIGDESILQRPKLVDSVGGRLHSANETLIRCSFDFCSIGYLDLVWEEWTSNDQYPHC